MPCRPSDHFGGFESPLGTRDRHLSSQDGHQLALRGYDSLPRAVALTNQAQAGFHIIFMIKTVILYIVYKANLQQGIYNHHIDQSYNGTCRVAAIAGTIILVPNHVFLSVRRVWRSGTRRWNLRVKWVAVAWLDRTTDTETEMSSFWWNFHHWLHWKLSKWQLPVQPMMKISSKWWHFRFSVRIVDPVWPTSTERSLLPFY